jgi:Sec7-like guanine-nucleotide exchange factor
MLNTDLHREEVSNKISKDEYINRFLSMVDNNNENKNFIDRKFLEEIYNIILKDPIVIPGQKISNVNNYKKKTIYLN